MKFDVKLREQLLRGILIDIKSRLEQDNDCGLEIEFSKCSSWKGEEFKYVFSMKLGDFSEKTSNAYDKFLELKAAAIEMFSYLINPEHIEVCSSAGRYSIEFELVSIIPSNYLACCDQGPQT